MEEAFAYMSGLKLEATMAAVLIENDEAQIFAIGDARIYLFRADGSIYILTEDQTLAAQRFRRRMGDLQFPLRDGQAEMYHEAIRADHDRDANRLGESYQRYTLKLAKGDRFLVCTDGLWRVLTWAGVQTIGERSMRLPAIHAALVPQIARYQADHTTYILYEH